MYEDEDMIPILGMMDKTIRALIVDLKGKRWTEDHIKIHVHMLYDIDQEKVDRLVKDIVGP